jgi:hypothetical protein
MEKTQKGKAFMSVRILRNFETAADTTGHIIRLEFDFADGERETITFGTEMLSSLAQSLIQAGLAAEKMRNAQPGSIVSIEQMWTAREVRVGTAPSANLIVAQFATREGPPVGVAMSHNLTRKTIELLMAELKKPKQKIHDN